MKQVYTALLCCIFVVIKEEDSIRINCMINIKDQDMNLTQNFIKMVEVHEGFKDKMYKDANGFPTIGFGTLIDSASLQYLMNSTISREQGESLLLNSASHVTDFLNNLVAHGLVVNQNQFEALADFCYNLGTNALLSSTLLKVIMKDPNNFQAIKTEFLKWDKIVRMDKNGNRNVVELPGLETRREDEFNLYSKSIDNA